MRSGSGAGVAAGGTVGAASAPCISTAAGRSGGASRWAAEEPAPADELAADVEMARSAAKREKTDWVMGKAPWLAPGGRGELIVDVSSRWRLRAPGLEAERSGAPGLPAGERRPPDGSCGAPAAS